jgi:prevent-host-death family protein
LIVISGGVTMREVTVGVRDLKAHLSEYLRQVRSGQTIIITDHGQTVGQIIPAGQPIEERLRSLKAAGLLAWNGQQLAPIDPTVINRSGKLLSDLVVEMREQDL